MFVGFFNSSSSSNSSAQFGFLRIIVTITVVAMLTGSGLFAWRTVERHQYAKQADIMLHEWGAGARLAFAEGLFPELNLKDSRPNWREVERRPLAWYNLLPRYQQAKPLSEFALQADEWAEAFARDQRSSLDEQPQGGMHLPPALEFTEPHRWRERPVFAFAWNESFTADPSKDAKPRVLLFESLTHSRNTPDHQRAQTKRLGHSTGSAEFAADRYLNGTGAVLSDGSLRRLPPGELPW